MISTFENKTPEIAPAAYVHPSADIIGNVVIGAGCWIGPGARIRGDYGRIIIGNNSCVEDNCIIHARPDKQTTIGEWVTIGHGAIVHNATVRDWALLGMGCIVSDWAVIGEWAVLGEGSLARQHQEIPDNRIAVGSPARVLDKEIDEAFKEQWRGFKKLYAELAGRYKEGLR